jgi:hypothetical protein
MVPLTLPWALAAGAAAIVALVAIYLWHRRHQQREVSSLLLWAAVPSPSSGGRTRERVRLPRTFWLELAALSFFALAAAGPLLPFLRRARPLVVVLDDSLSMQESRDRARTFVERELGGDAHAPIRIILAGESPHIAGPAASSSRDALRQLDAWRCAAPAGDLDAAIALATQTGGRDALVLVVTDHAPATPPSVGRIRWNAFGKATPNLAFIGAARSSSERDRATFEVANFADRAQSTTFAIASAGRVLQRTRVELGPNARKRIDAELPPRTATIEASIAGGAAFDDRVVLLPERRAPLPVRVEIADAALRDLVVPALAASVRVRLVNADPRLVISDHSGEATDATWRFELDARKATSAFVGPFIVDRNHPLTDGVRFDGVIWGAAPLNAAAMQPIVLAGNRVLLAASEHTVRMSLDPATSNVQRAPAWPSLLWNLVDWRDAHTPGLRYANVRLGGNALATIDDDRARVRAPDGSTRDVLPANAHALVVAATQTGIWTIETKSGAYRFSTNALFAEESDFAHAVTGTWGGWSSDALEANGFVDAAWIALALALAALVLQQRVVAGEAHA